MKISILTPSYNQGEFIEKNIQSVLSQSYPDVEHIIIDGGSTDNTLDILNKYKHLKWISEKDKGQADALNKGLLMASGEIVGWINSDDYYQADILKDVVSHFHDTTVNWIIGNLTYYYAELNIQKPIKNGIITYEKLLKNPDIVKQPGAFFRKEIIENVGGWESDHFMVMDFDLWLKISKKSPPKIVDKNYAFFVIHGGQKTNYKNNRLQIMEINKVLKENNVSLLGRFPIILRKHKNALKQLVKIFLIKIKIIDKRLEFIAYSEKNDLFFN